MSYAEPDPYGYPVPTPKAPPAQGVACYYCRAAQATAWTGSINDYQRDTPICQACDMRARLRRGQR